MKPFTKMSKLVLSTSVIILGGVSCGGGGGDDGNKAVVNNPPVAAAGANMDVSKNFNVQLDGSASTDPDKDNLTYTWTQLTGMDVTAGVGNLSGVRPAFDAPENVGTLTFELVVNDGITDSVSDTVTVSVFEDVNVRYFVDGDAGSDSAGNGSKGQPFASIAKAVCELTSDQQDIYVKTRANGGTYQEMFDPCAGEPARGIDKILTIPAGTSLYGGYGENWVRDVNTVSTLVTVTHHGFQFGAVDLNTWFSGFDVVSEDSPSPKDSVFAMRVMGGSANIYIEDNRLSAGDVALGVAANPGSSYGLLVAFLEGAYIARNTIKAGMAGDGLDVGNIFPVAATTGGQGSSSSSSSGAGGGRGGGFGGGSGGKAGNGIGSNGSKGGSGGGGAGGGAGGAGGSGNKAANGSGGGVGDPGNIGAKGLGGNGSGSMRVFEDGGQFAAFSIGFGVTGTRGVAGYGGGGGGGGEATSTAVNGGGGGGGGAGGRGGQGGPAGPGGGASIGLFIANVNTSVISDNEILSDMGGVGASGGRGQVGGSGGNGGSGAVGSCSIYGCANQGGNGGKGGKGGKGGNGGRGGAGGGGPSYGIAIGNNIAPLVKNNSISSGQGNQAGYGANDSIGGNGGNSYAVYDNSVKDGITPVLINNTLNFSNPGEGGGSTSTIADEKGVIGKTGKNNWEVIL